MKNNTVKGIVLENNESYSTKYVVSACDARQTFYELIGNEFLTRDTIKKIDNLIPSYSAFCVYMGINSDYLLNSELESSIWFMNSHDSAEIFSKMLKCESIYLGITSPSAKETSLKKEKQTLCLATSVPFMSKDYWKNNENRQILENRLISMAGKIIPGFSKSISLKFNATPLTLYKLTYNYAGAAYGWEGRPSQFGNPDISEKTMIKNLYLAGHWTNMGSGVSSVANSGFDTAEMILLKENIL